ncbi:hypothetical protein Q5752_001229 [Cryptotrichosporon argae]
MAASDRLYRRRPESGPVLVLHAVYDPLFNRRYNLVAFDAPGHGQTVVSGPWPAAFTIESQAELLAAALHELGITRVHVIGVGGGVYPAAGLAIGYPDMIVSLATIAAGFNGGAATRMTLVQAVRDQDAEALDAVTIAIFELGLGSALSSAFHDLKEEHIGLARRECQRWARPGDHATKFLLMPDGPEWPTLTSPDTINPILAEFLAAPASVREKFADGPLTPPLSARQPSTPRDMSGFDLPPGMLTVGDMLDDAAAHAGKATAAAGVIVEIEVVTVAA